MEGVNSITKDRLTRRRRLLNEPEAGNTQQVLPIANPFNVKWPVMLAGAQKLIEIPNCFVDGSRSVIGNVPIDWGNRTKKEGVSLADVIEVRLPPSPDYLPVIRATVGVLAGIMSFNYDEILQLRVAVSEAFNLATRWAKKEGEVTGPDEVSLRFVVTADQMEILVTNRLGFIGQIDTERELESCATLESLMDGVQFGGGAANEPLIRMTKSNTAGTN